MTKLERYFAREFIPTFLVGAILYVALFLFFSLAGRGQFLGALPVGSTLRWLAFQIPANAVQAFPLAMVFAVLLAFGRLARDNELLASRMSGLSLARLVRPILWFAALLVLFALAMAEFVVPKTNERVSTTWWDSVDGGGTALARLAGKQLAVGQYQIFYSGFDVPTQQLVDVRLEFWHGQEQNVYFAKSGKLVGKNLELNGVRGFGVNFATEPIDLTTNQTGKLTFALTKSKDALVNENAGGGFEDSRSISSWWREWQTSVGPARRDAAVQFGAKTAVPFANFVVLLLVLPLATSFSRSVASSFGLAAVVTLLYFVCLSIGQVLGLQGIVPGMLGPWLANIVFVLVGVLLLRREAWRG